MTTHTDDRPTGAQGAAPKRKASLRVRLLAIAVVIVVSLVFLELALRIYNPIPTRLRGTELVLHPNERMRLTNPGSSKLEPAIELARNAFGFRGADAPADFERHLTVITVGGSTTECCFLSEGRTWTDALGRDLGTDFRDVWVNNAGLDGHSTFGHLHLVRQLIVGIRPKYAVFLVGVNDVNRDDLTDFDAHARMDHRPLLDRIVAASELLSTAEALSRARRAELAGVGHESGDLDLAKLPEGRDDASAVDEYLRRQREVFAPRFADRLRTLVSECRAAGIEPVLVTQPALYGGETDASTGVAIGAQQHGQFTVAVGRRALAIFNEATSAVGRDAKVEVVDLAAKLPSDSRYYYDWIHFTNEGAEAVGRAIADGIAPFVRARNPEFIRR